MEKRRQGGKKGSNCRGAVGARQTASDGYNGGRSLQWRQHTITALRGPAQYRGIGVGPDASG